MKNQNIYDNDIFFSSYKKLREKPNANDLIEKPVLFSLLPKLKDKTVLDLGCGFGEHCKEYINLGAKSVVGIDISENMLEVARKENSDQRIIYQQLAIEDIGQLNIKVDLVVSSLVFHYVQDFDKLIKDIYKILNQDGCLIFSQEHPLSTSFSTGERWTKNELGEKIYANISNYSIEGSRNSTWFIDNIIKYHRTFSSITNTIVESGFIIEKIVEPTADEKVLEEFPSFKDLEHKPDFLFFKVKKLDKTIKKRP